MIRRDVRYHDFATNQPRDPLPGEEAVVNLRGQFFIVSLPSSLSPDMVSGQAEVAFNEKPNAVEKRKLLIAASGAPFAPTAGDLVEIGGEDWLVHSITGLNPDAADPIIWSALITKIGPTNIPSVYEIRWGMSAVALPTLEQLMALPHGLQAYTPVGNYTAPEIVAGGFFHLVVPALAPKPTPVSGLTVAGSMLAVAGAGKGFAVVHNGWNCREVGSLLHYRSAFALNGNMTVRYL